jgi:SAM-dependent methyltransferase
MFRMRRRPLDLPPAPDVLPPIGQLCASQWRVADPATLPPATLWAHLEPDVAHLGTTVQAAALRAMPAERFAHHFRQDLAPLPHCTRREGYYAQSDLAYWLSGLADVALLSGLIEEHARSRGCGLGDQPYTIFDLGAASGRVLRHWLHHQPAMQLYGSDTNPRHIQWMRNHLSSSLITFQNAMIPHLPLPDDFVDVVSAYSMFTHVDEYEEGWLLELWRVLRPGGLAFLTVHTDETWEQLRQGHPLAGQFQGYTHVSSRQGVSSGQGTKPVGAELFDGPMPGQRVVLRCPAKATFGPHVFHSRQYLQERWGRIFRLEQAISHAHGDHQTGLVLLKESAS